MRMRILYIEGREVVAKDNNAQMSYSSRVNGSKTQRNFMYFYRFRKKMLHEFGVWKCELLLSEGEEDVEEKEGGEREGG